MCILLDTTSEYLKAWKHNENYVKLEAEKNLYMKLDIIVVLRKGRG